MLSTECGFAVVTASMYCSKGRNLQSSVLIFFFFLIISFSFVFELCYPSYAEEGQ